MQMFVHSLPRFVEDPPWRCSGPRPSSYPPRRRGGDGGSLAGWRTSAVASFYLIRCPPLQTFSREGRTLFQTVSSVFNEPAVPFPCGVMAISLSDEDMGSSGRQSSILVANRVRVQCRSLQERFPCFCATLNTEDVLRLTEQSSM